MNPQNDPFNVPRTSPPSVDGILRSSEPQPVARPRPVPPSVAPHPFQPAEFFEPPKLPVLPRIKDTPPPRHAELPKRSSGMRDMLSVVGVLASALLLAFVLINFVFQSYQVEGPSMRETLQDRDHLIVWKVDKTIANFSGNAYIPNRGDIVIFNEPSGAEPGAPAGKQLIKRVIALPGERVVMRGTEVTVFNQEHPEGFNPDTTLPYGEKIVNTEASNVDVTVAKDHVFVAGDNRDNSLDSRVFDPIPSDLIVGKLAVRILPLNTFKLF